MAHRLPDLCKSRYGVYYLRTYGDSRETKVSLRTKDFNTAKILMSQYHFWKSMSINKFEADIAKGIFKTDGSSEDVKALVDFLKLPASEALVQGHANALKPPPGAELLKYGAVVAQNPFLW